jgi:catechol 2,3-dioxygenase-like lactoylglutathione lyase family enzyme
MASLRSVILLQRDVAKAAKFYSEGLGLRISVLTERWAELKGDGPNDTTALSLKAVDG